jgi:D-serine dehydratase
MQPIESPPGAWLEKGLPHSFATNGDAPAPGKWNVLRGELHFPILVLRESALSANIRAMARWCTQNGFDLAPHGKTTMCPRIFDRQVEAGAWGITVATVSQALVCLHAGINRILIANQVVGSASVHSLVQAMNDDEQADICCLADSVEGVEHLASRLQRSNARRPVGVLIEVGKPGWRAGVRSVADAWRVYDAILANSGSLTFRGVEAFEGPAKDAFEVEEFLIGVAAIAELLAARSGGNDLIFSAGGTSYLGPVGRVLRGLPRGWKRLLRSGCYVTHDHGIYAQQQETSREQDPSLPGFSPALELWACVQSLPDPGVAILTFGKRDCAYDISLPVPLDLPGAKITAINDQHAYLSYPAGTKLSVGALLRFGISHPCTAFDKWRVIPLVDESYNVIDFYRTYF